MRRKPVIVFVFLLMFYISPVLFTVSYIHPEQNISKEFSLSAGEGWLTGWTYRQNITLHGTSGAGTNYQINITVTYDSEMQSDFDDIRFTDDDGTTLLDHWRETYTASTTALFWVEVADSLNSNQLIYMYYGNDAVSTVSNGTTTFLFYEDWSSQSLDAWQIRAGHGDGQTTWSPAGATHGGYVAKVEGDPADSYQIGTDFVHTAAFATRFRANIEEAGVGNTGRMGTGWSSTWSKSVVQTIAGGESFAVYDDDGNPDDQAMTTAYFDTYVTFEIQRGLQVVGHNYTMLIADGVDAELGDFHPDELSNPVCSIHVQDSEDDIYSDWVACRKYITLEPHFDSFGAEENNYSWQFVESVVVGFWVPVNTVGLDLFLIFLGLCLVPGSTLYLVRGGKDSMSQDKFLYFCIAFVIGWGLIIGGIM